MICDKTWLHQKRRLTRVARFDITIIFGLGILLGITSPQQSHLRPWIKSMHPNRWFSDGYFKSWRGLLTGWPPVYGTKSESQPLQVLGLTFTYVIRLQWLYIRIHLGALRLGLLVKIWSGKWERNVLHVYPASLQALFVWLQASLELTHEEYGCVPQSLEPHVYKRYLSNLVATRGQHPGFEFAKSFWMLIPNLALSAILDCPGRFLNFYSLLKRWNSSFRCLISPCVGLLNRWV